LLARSTHSTYCPFKGDAAYWTIHAGDRAAENAVWSYEIPFEEVSEIGEFLAFYSNRVDAVEVEVT
jgi:uncharacterized protein (DUF427 family)